MKASGLDSPIIQAEVRKLEIGTGVGVRVGVGVGVGVRVGTGES